MENTGRTRAEGETRSQRRFFYPYLAVILFASAVYLLSIISPPSLMDDVDAVQAQIARNMLTSGDWVSARLDGIAYLEKAPLIYWLIAISYRIFGFTDWAARIPIACAAISLAWVTAAFAEWAFGKREAFYAGLCISTCIGLFLFTRILIPDVMLTLVMTISIWSVLRLADEDEVHPRLWSYLLAASLGVGLLLKSLIAIVFPLGAGLIYLLITRQLFSKRTWQRFRPLSGLLLIVAIAAPWHILATLQNPPYFAWTMRSAPGEYHGFFWFYFINEQLLRFLNLRYPRDYNTVPRLYFWLFHLLWLFPWSAYLPALTKLSFRPADRAGRTRVMALCWIGVVLVFFSFSTTQEYYSMPCYPAFALLLASAMALERDPLVRFGTRTLAAIAGCAAVTIIAILIYVRNVPTPGDISTALSHNPQAYTLSLGHMEDLTLYSFAYLRFPLIVAGCAFAVGFAGMLFFNGRRAMLAAGIMMVVFFAAARLALVVFDPYMSSRPLANALLKSPPGRLVVDHHYYTFSSIFFYTNEPALLRNGRRNNLVYGSYAPGAPDVFADDAQFKKLWLQPQRAYLVADDSAKPALNVLVGSEHLNTVLESGGKVLLTNAPLINHNP